MFTDLTTEDPGETEVFAVVRLRGGGVGLSKSAVRVGLGRAGQGTEHRAQSACDRAQGAGYRLQVTGHRLQ